MRFSFFAVLSGLAALAVVKAFPAENLQPDVLSEEVSESNEELCLTCKSPVMSARNGCSPSWQAYTRRGVAATVSVTRLQRRPPVNLVPGSMREGKEQSTR